MKTLQEREEDFKKELEPYNFPEILKQDFFDYWTEPNKSKTKMRFESEKTWDLGRRLRRWESQGFKKYANVKPVNSVKMEIKPPQDIWEELDQLLETYQKRFDKVEFSQFGNYYDFLKENKLLRQFDKEDIAIIKASYSDNYSCRCAVVKMTIDAYINSGLRFCEIKRLRNA